MTVGFLALYHWINRLYRSICSSIHITHESVKDIFHSCSWLSGTITHFIYVVLDEKHCICNALVEIQIENLVNFKKNVETQAKVKRIRELKYRNYGLL